MRSDTGMGSRVPSRDKVGAADKAQYGTWDDARQLLDRIRRRPGWSWRRTSKALGKSDGWAHNAYRHRGLMSASDAEDIRSLWHALRAEDAEQTTPTTTREDAMPRRHSDTEHYKRVNKEIRAALAYLIDERKWSRRDLSLAIGYQSPDGLSGLMSKLDRDPLAGMTRAKLEKLRQLVEGAKMTEAEVATLPTWTGEQEQAEQAEVEQPKIVPNEKVAAKMAAFYGSAPQDPFAAFDTVRETLLGLAELVERAGAGVPAYFRDPYTKLAEQLAAIAASLTR